MLGGGDGRFFRWGGLGEKLLQRIIIDTLPLMNEKRLGSSLDDFLAEEGLLADTEFVAWKDEHRKRVAQFPEEIRKAHKHSSNHLAEVTTSDLCGCFYCCAIFKPDEIKEWIDLIETGIGQTAMCPYCQIDSVIGSNSGYPITVEFLTQMHRYWF